MAILKKVSKSATTIGDLLKQQEQQMGTHERFKEFKNERQAEREKRKFFNNIGGDQVQEIKSVKDLEGFTLTALVSDDWEDIELEGSGFIRTSNEDILSELPQLLEYGIKVIIAPNVPKGFHSIESQATKIKVDGHKAFACSSSTIPHNFLEKYKNSEESVYTHRSEILFRFKNHQKIDENHQVDTFLKGVGKTREELIANGIDPIEFVKSILDGAKGILEQESTPSSQTEPSESIDSLEGELVNDLYDDQEEKPSIALTQDRPSNRLPKP